MKKLLRAKIFIRIFILFIGLSFPYSQISEAFGRASSPIHINQDIIRGIELLYDWEFDKAENLFNKNITERPKDPGAYFYSAMVTWSRLASGFWSPQTVRQYGERIDRAISVAKKKIEKKEANSFTYFYLGGALGFKGRFRLMEREYLSSFFLAIDAIEALKTCLQMDPNNRDVLLGLGIFDYYTARLSGMLKFLTYLLLHRGDKEEGLRKLHVVADEAIYSSIEAKSLLIHIYLFLEREHYKALSFAKELTERFRNNPRYRFLLGVTYIRMGKDSKCREIVDSFHQRSREERSKKRASLWGNQALYLEASYHLFCGHYEVARSKLDTILSRADPSSDPAMIVWPLLKKGMIYDIEGEREKALKYYHRILELENGAGAQFLAEKYIDEPAIKRDPFLGY